MSQDERFITRPPLLVGKDGHEFAWTSHNERYVQLVLRSDGDDLTVDEARALRDWLNSVLPNE